MRFIPTTLAGAVIVEPELLADARGFFARTFCQREFDAQGLVSSFVQSNISLNHKKGTVRGLHYQMPPACEVKLVRCTTGTLYDVIVDLRQGSPTYRQHVGIELSASNRRVLYIPEMFAHGFQTLEDETEVSYQMSQFYVPDKGTGIRFDDPVLKIQWPLSVSVVSDKDRRWPLLT
jgi:dTDP-4-dehydrorhamnose 3,5-epimerase